MVDAIADKLVAAFLFLGYGNGGMVDIEIVADKI